MLGINNWVVAWTPAGNLDDPNAGKIRIGRFANNHAWSQGYALVEGVISGGRSRLKKQFCKMMLLFHTIVVRDGIDLSWPISNFSRLTSMRRRIIDDIPGSDQSRRILGRRRHGQKS